MKTMWKLAPGVVSSAAIVAAALPRAEAADPVPALPPNDCALEFDGSVIVWRQGSTGTFDDVGQLMRVGQPIYGLQVEDSGDRFSVHVHPEGTRTWIRQENGKFVIRE